MSNAVDHANPPLVSVIILNYNGLRFAEQCVRSVLNSDYPNFEVIVVDNDSIDGSYELLCRSFGTIPNLRVVRNSRNLGYAQGNNVGYAKSKGEVIVFLNVDTRVERTWLSELVRAATRDCRVGGAQSKLITLKDGKEEPTHGMDCLGFVYMQARGSSSFSEDQPGEPFYPDGASMAFRRSVLKEVALEGQPFDGDYFLYFEDNDLGWRARLRGYSIAFAPSSVAYHYRGGTASSASQHARTFSFAKNRLMTLIKNYELGNLIRILPLVLFLETSRMILLLPKESARALAKLRAPLFCLANLREIWRKRLLVQLRIRAVTDSEVIRHMHPLNFSTLRQTFGALY